MRDKVQTNVNGNATAEPTKSTVGAFIDIDGVVMKGGIPFDYSVKAIKKLWDNDVACVFVTNGTYCTNILIEKLQKTLNLPITNDHVVVAPSPCTELNEYHDKHVLLCCQDDSHELSKELGFKSIITIPELVEIFPELDYCDHKRRQWLAENPPDEKLKRAQATFKPIEAVLLLGEPVMWERALQILLDVIMTNGDPRCGTSSNKVINRSHLPLIACNLDLTFKGSADMPRFGHGAFLECLEHLFEKITKKKLRYEYLMGKPFLVTYEYATKKMIKLAAKNGSRLKKVFAIGDNPDVDIKGANIYKEHLDKLKHRKIIENDFDKVIVNDFDADVCDVEGGESVHALDVHHTYPQVESILVCTGVYRRENDVLFHLRNLFGRSLSIQSPMASPAIVDMSNPFAGHKPPMFFETTCVTANEVRSALSRMNSYVNFFEDHKNIPDVIVNDIERAVEYIVHQLKIDHKMDANVHQHHHNYQQKTIVGEHAAKVEVHH